ncbi:MAG: radical SAM protein [Candidatus Aenigmarchaeota archaeon]|nr:radical SAM protein [Candidatus Aenigmarchaeota archaeon]
MLIDPVEKAKEVEKVAVKNSERKYYRLVRPARFYGGIASSDCSGCNLRCVFCWSNDLAREGKIGNFYSPEQVLEALKKCAEKFNYSQLRLTGNEPTIGRKHLLKLLELIDQTNYSFILETNGILIGHDKSYAKDLSKFDCLHVRVSIKGTNEEEFNKLTLAKPESFQLQLNALKNLLDQGVPFHPAVMLSFSTKENYERFLGRIKEIDKSLEGEVEEEYVFLYPHVVKRLNKARIKPLITYSPNNLPSRLI